MINKPGHGEIWYIKIDDIIDPIYAKCIFEKDNKWVLWFDDFYQSYDPDVVRPLFKVPEINNTYYKLTANWLINTLFPKLKSEKIKYNDSKISKDKLNCIIFMIIQGLISNKLGKDLFEIIWNKGGDPFLIYEQSGMGQIKIPNIKEILQNIINNNQDKFEQLKSKPSLLGWFIGQVMKETDGKANPETVSNILKDMIED